VLDSPQIPTSKNQSSTENKNQEGGKQKPSSLGTFAKSAVYTLSAGLNKDNKPTKEEEEAHPIANIAGSIAGTIPYTLIPGSAPVKMGIMGARGALQTYNEGGDAKDIATSGIVEGLLGGAGGAVNKVLNVAGKAASKLAVSGIVKWTGVEVPKAASEAVELFAKGDLDTLSKNPTNVQLLMEYLDSIAPKSKSFGKAVYDAGKSAATNVATGALAGVGLNELSGNKVDTSTAALAGGAAGAFKAAFIKDLGKELPAFGRSFIEGAIKNLPAEAINNKQIFMTSMAERFIKDSKKLPTTVQFTDYIKDISKQYDKAQKIAASNLNKATYATGQATIPILSGTVGQPTSQLMQTK